MAAHVLIVEDDPDQAESTKRVLESCSDVELAIEISHDLTSAVKRIKQGGVEIVLLDLTLPDSCGTATIRAIRDAKAAESVRIIALTGWGGEEIVEPAKLAGANEVLTKPADPRKLQRTLEGEIIFQRDEQRVLDIKGSFGKVNDLVAEIVEMIKNRPPPATSAEPQSR